MADVSGFDPNTPSGTSQILDGDDKIRSIQSDLKATWEEEHFFQDGSAASGGVHKIGSAKPHRATASAVSAAGDDGRIMVTTDSRRLFDVSSDDGPVAIGDMVASRVDGSNRTDGDVAAVVVESGAVDAQEHITFNVVYDSEPQVLLTRREVDSSSTNIENWYAHADASGFTAVAVDGSNNTDSALVAQASYLVIGLVSSWS